MVSPFGGVGATAALVFVLLVAGIKAVWEDVKRHQEDKTMNASTTHRANPDGVVGVVWLGREEGSVSVQGSAVGCSRPLSIRAVP